MTAAAACRGIREHDPSGTIGLLTDEANPPYKRPPLTKGLWAGADEGSIWISSEELGVDVELGRRVTALDLDARTATDAGGETFAYERLLLATGGTPRQVAAWGDDVVYFRTLGDYRALRAAAGTGTRAVAVGGGFIGSEIAAALATSGCSVTMVFPEPGIGARLFPAGLSAFVNDYYRSKGVDVRADASVAGIARDAMFEVTLGSGDQLDADIVVAGLGIVPNTELAESSGLPVDDGILVDELGHVRGHEDVFAAGDVARFPVPALGGDRRVEHEDHANSHGRAVGANMAGANAPYDHLPFFYSDLFELGYEAVGDVDSRLETVTEWAEPNRQGVICYVDAGARPRGFLLWDVWGKVDAARDLITAGAPVSGGQLRQLFD
jgi:3-phenylpropionate/trans-cinnamate dioxygenase ferredoxin reductase component